MDIYNKCSNKSDRYNSFVFEKEIESNSYLAYDSSDKEKLKFYYLIKSKCLDNYNQKKKFNQEVAIIDKLTNHAIIQATQRENKYNLANDIPTVKYPTREIPDFITPKFISCWTFIEDNNVNKDKSLIQQGFDAIANLTSKTPNKVQLPKQPFSTNCKIAGYFATHDFLIKYKHRNNLFEYLSKYCKDIGYQNRIHLLRFKLFPLYKKLHSQGICHMNLSSDNILCGFNISTSETELDIIKNTDFNLIDFSNSINSNHFSDKLFDYISLIFMVFDYEKYRNVYTNKYKNNIERTLDINETSPIYSVIQYIKNLKPKTTSDFNVIYFGVIEKINNY